MAEFKRNVKGLIEGVEYKFNEDGSVNWRAMINPKHLVINKQYSDILVKTLKKPFQEIKVEEVEDNKLLILLQGIKELAFLRGYKKVKPKVVYVGDDRVVVSTQIDWIGNFETGMEPISFGDVGAASHSNTNGFGKKFLEPIATNRAFVRAVRNFLGINVLANDEIDSSSSPEIDASNISEHSPQAVLEKALKKAGFDFTSFKERVIKNHKDKITSDPTKWNSLEDISPKDTFILLPLLQRASG